MSMRKTLRPSLPARQNTDQLVKPAGAGPKGFIRSTTFSALLLVLAAPALAQPDSKEGPKLGKPIAAEDLAPWDISIGPDGAGLPPGDGTVKAGEATFAAKCQPCHNEKGAGTPNDRLVGGRGSLPGDKPAVKTVGSYWPYATTLFDYIRRAMPLYESKSLTNDEVYGLVAYLLNLNGVIAESETMNAQTLPKVAMPNRDGFIRFTRGK
jgi:S-disulfanyl-L-cysteine oxidoreductase SoxD